VKSAPKSLKSIFTLRSFSVRVFFVFGVLIFSVNVLAARYFNLQISNHQEWKKEALAQQTKIIDFSPERGEILTRDKEGNLQPLAVNKHVFNLAISPNDAGPDKEKAAQLLSDKLSLPYPDVLKKLSKENDLYEVLVKNIPEEKLDEIKQLEIGGLIIEDEKSRFYPLKEFASHAIGFVGFNDQDELSGRYGIELGLDSVLSGTGPDKESVESFLSRGSFLGVSSLYKKNGDNVVLTIDPMVQRETEKLLAEEVEKWKAESGNAIVMDPKTGRIIAFAGYPNFDPNQYAKEEDLSVFLNSAVSLRYEPGSVFKPFSLAAGLSSKKISPTTEYFDGGEIKIDGRTIRNAGSSKPNKNISMSLFLERSYNLGAVFIQRTVGNEFFKNFIVKNLDFEEKSGIDLPQEIQSSFRNLYSNEAKDIDFATASFGQGVAVTPIKLLQEFSAFGNNGVMMKPFIVGEIIFDDGKTAATEPKIAKQTMAREVVQQALPLLENVVSGEHGSGKAAGIKGYRIAGKTGTGEIALEDGKGYSEKVNHSFLGLAPVSDPKFVILTRIEDPKGVRYAEATAVPLFRKIMKFVLDYYAVPPDAVVSP